MPAAVGDIQVNHCRNPSCPNFGIPVRTAPVRMGRLPGQSVPRKLPNVTAASCPTQGCINHGKPVAAYGGAYHRHGRSSGGAQRYRCAACNKTFSVVNRPSPVTSAVPACRDLYKIQGTKKFTPALLCGGCGEQVPVKSNAAIAEELARLSEPLRRHAEHRASPSCPNRGCPNHGRSVSEHPEGYRKYGRTRAGSIRWRCKAKGCGRTVSMPTVATRRYRRILDNAFILRLLMNKMPLKRICETAGISPAALYGTHAL